MTMKQYLDLIRALKMDDRPLSRQAAEAISELIRQSQNDMAEMTRLRRKIGGMTGE